MTDKRQSDALRLADALERPGYGWHSTPAQCAAELRRLHAEIETLRTGYEAARLEIESLKAQQPGAAYAALPEPIAYQIAVLKACEHGDALVGWRVEPSRQSFDASMRPKRKLYTEGDMRAFADATCAIRPSHGQAPAQPVATAGGSLARIIEEKIAAMTPSEASAFMAARAELAASGNDQAAPDMRDPYGGAREDLAIWRKRALEAEALNRKFATSVNGPTFMGEPADSDGALMAREIHESQEDSLLICASDLQHSAIYDNHVEMQSCMRAVAARIAALVHAAPKAEPAAPAAVAGCTRSHPHENMDSACRAKAAIAEMRNKAARGAEATAHDLDRFVVMLTSAPTTQPAPKQEAQEPAAVVVSCHTPSGKRVALYSAKQDLPIGTQLYTAPQPSPAAQVDALDAARYRLVRRGQRWSVINGIGNGLRAEELDAAIDAARAAQEGKTNE